MKTCCKCKNSKSLSLFSKNRTTKDGLAHECKECCREFYLRHRAANGDRIRAADAARLNTPERKAVVAKYQTSAKGKAAAARAHANWRGNHPDRVAAATAVGNAIKSGRLKRQLCMVCGARRVEGHHPDYSRQLDVVWLCIKHHKEVHVMAQVLNDTK